MPDSRPESRTENMPSNATAAERSRFVAARPGDAEAAEAMLAAHLEWRQRFLPLPASAKSIGNGLPAFAQMLPGVACKDGRRVMCVLGAMYDSTAGSNEECKPCTDRIHPRKQLRQSSSTIKCGHSAPAADASFLSLSLSLVRVRACMCGRRPRARRIL